MRRSAAAPPALPPAARLDVLWRCEARVLDEGTSVSMADDDRSTEPEASTARSSLTAACSRCERADADIRVVSAAARLRHASMGRGAMRTSLPLARREPAPSSSVMTLASSRPALPGAANPPLSSAVCGTDSKLSV